MLLRREALGQSIFDERFFLYCEDVDLCARLADAGWEVRITRDAEIVHYDGSSLAAADPDMQLQKTRNLRTLYFQRHGRLARIGFDTVVALGFAIRTVMLALTGGGRHVAARRARYRLHLKDALLLLRSVGAR